MNVRPALRDDVDAIVEVVNANSLATDGAPAADAAEVRTWLSGELDLASVVAVSPDGRVLAYGDARETGDDPKRFWFDVRPLPGEHAAAAAILDALEAHGSPGALARLTVLHQDEDLQRLARERGYRVVRRGFRMFRDLGEPVAEPDWPDGIELRPFVPGRDEQAVYDADIEAFADTWDFVADPIDEWLRWLQDRYDPSLWFVAYDGDEIAGICLCRAGREGDPELGWVHVLAVRPRWRRRGLGRALLLHGFRELRARGLPRVGLGVDAESPTGAVTLYERAGMTVGRRSATWEKRL